MPHFLISASKKGAKVSEIKIDAFVKMNSETYKDTVRREVVLEEIQADFEAVLRKWFGENYNIDSYTNHEYNLFSDHLKSNNF